MDFKELYSILGEGITLCHQFIGTPECDCCGFEGNGSCLMLLPGEKDYLLTQDSEHLRDFVDKGTIDGTTCNMKRRVLKGECEFDCTYKPFDCLVYPFFPANVVQNSNGYEVTLLGGFPRCPLFKYMKNNSATEDELQEHMFNVAKAGIYLYRNSMLNWMKKVSTLFSPQSYTRQYHITITYLESYHITGGLK